MKSRLFSLIVVFSMIFGMSMAMAQSKTTRTVSTKKITKTNNKRTPTVGTKKSTLTPDERRQLQHSYLYVKANKVRVFKRTSIKMYVAANRAGKLAKRLKPTMKSKSKRVTAKHIKLHAQIIQQHAVALNPMIARGKPSRKTRTAIKMTIKLQKLAGEVIQRAEVNQNSKKSKHIKQLAEKTELLDKMVKKFRTLKPIVGVK